MSAPISLSTTDHALLASLTICPMSGYELREFIKGSIGNFWSESYGQLYPALKRLESAGLVRSSEKPTGKRPKRVYAITAAGRRLLAKWLQTPATEQVPRVELLLKIFFARAATPMTSLIHIERHRAVTEGLLNRYRGIVQQLRREQPHHPDLPFWLATARFGELRAEADLQWCTEMKAQFAKHDSSLSDSATK